LFLIDKMSLNEKVWAWVTVRGVSQKFLASYIKKNNTKTVTSLFFYIICANLNALIPSFMQLLYTGLEEEFIFPLRKSFTDSMMSFVTWKLCATHILSATGRNRSQMVLVLGNIVDGVIILSHIQPTYICCFN